MTVSSLWVKRPVITATPYNLMQSQLLLPALECHANTVNYCHYPDVSGFNN